MKTILSSILFILLTAFAAPTATQDHCACCDKQADIDAIKSMIGTYKVSFDFAETFSPDTGYTYHKRYSAWGVEHVELLEESENLISLQHLLIINDSMIVKHWRQDWIYESTELLEYYKDKEWNRRTLDKNSVKGTWTQRVFQVDDGPRYESRGTWVHVDGRHFWQSVCDAPLPRREFSKRSDYNVMKRKNHFEIEDNGWVYIQDNEKIVRNKGIDRVICHEKGVERFTKGNYNAGPALRFWNEQKEFWKDVREVWGTVYKENKNLKLRSMVDKQPLHSRMFRLGNKSCKNKSYKPGSAKKEIKAIITPYIK